MKHKYFSLLALIGAMTVSTSAMAQWAEPTAPKAPAAPAEYEGNWVTPESGGQYYLYNVGSGLFLGGGQTWGTRGIVLCDSVVLVSQDPVTINTSSGNTTANYVLPFEFQTNALNESAWTIIAMNNSKNTAGAMYFVGEDGAQTWIDGDEGRWGNYGAWTLTEVEGGYMIQNSYAVTKYAENGEVAFGVDGNNTSGGWATTWTDLAVQPQANSAIVPWIVWRFVSAEDGEAVAAYAADFKAKVNSEDYQAILAAYAEAKKAYQARLQLYELLVSTTELGYTVNTEDATAVYNFADATAEELEAAFGALKAEINRAQWAEMWKDASEEYPLEVTEDCLTNPNFDGNINGWECTFVSGQNATNVGYQGASYSNGDVSISQFIEAWRKDASPYTIGDGFLRQTVYGLPGGKYVLEADVISVYQWGDAAGSNPTKGVYLYIEADGSQAKAEVASGDGKPEHFSVAFIAPNNATAITFGLKTESATANWIAADNFRITYYGATTLTPAQAILDLAIKSAEAIDLDEAKAYAETKSALATAIDQAKQVLAASSDDEACETATANLKAAQAALNESIAAYKKLYNYIDPNTGELTKYVDQVGSNDHWDELAEQLENLQDDLNEAYEAGTLTAEEINEKIASVPTIIRDYLSGDNIQKGDDVTLLMVNPGFDTNLEGWEVRSGATPTIANGLAEVYQAKFDIHQVIKDMPAGVYNITLQGFTRNQPGGKRMAFTEEDQAGTTFAIYTASNEAKIQNILAGGSPVLLNQRGDETEPENYINVDNGVEYDIAAKLEDGTVIYMPNGMPSARVHFDNGGYQTTIRVVNAQRGDLDLGIRCTTTQEWCLWDNLSIVYDGQDIQAYLEMIDARAEEFTDVVNKLGAYENESTGATLNLINQEGQKLVDDVLGRIEAKDDIEDPDEALALLDQIAAVQNYIQDGADYALEAYQFASILNDYAMSLFASSDTELPEYLSDTMASLEDCSQIANNEAFEAINATIKAKWAKYIFADVEDEPADKAEVTGIIFNYDYNLWGTGASADYWMNPGAAANTEMEVYNTDSINVYQELEGLKPGFYELTVQGFYRAGLPGELTDSLSHVQNAYMFAETSKGLMTKRILNAMDDASVESLGDGESVISTEQIPTLEAPVYIPNTMACAENYFLTYEKYNNSLMVQVGEDGKMTIGIRKNTHIEGDWTIFTNWKLFFLGKTGANFQEDISSVSSINAAGKVGQVFSIDGTQLNSLRRGINIVRMSDGNVRKVLVK